MAGLSLHGRSEKIRDAMTLTTPELEEHRDALEAQLAYAMENGITRQVEEATKLLGRIQFELGSRSVSLLSADAVLNELAIASR